MREVQPHDADAAARVLADAARSGERVVLQGGGTKSDWRSRAIGADILLSTGRLNQLVAHRHGDLTATIEAGATLAAVNQALSRHGQWLPLDPAWPDRATIGGLVATNDAGPRRHRYGAPRDLIIGVEIARPDGVRAKAGGIVVKNVAGYDLARLMTGSFGTLGLILTATFKLYPLPAASRTVVADLPTHAAAGALAAAINASQLTPSAVELQTSPLRVLVRFESTERSVQHQAEQALQQVASCGGKGEIAAGALELRMWDAHGERPWSDAGIVLKVTRLPGALADTLDAIAAAAHGRDWEAIGRAGLGVLLVRVDVEESAAPALIQRLRQSCAPDVGSVVVLRAPAMVKDAVGSAAAGADAFHVMQSVKAAFDPRGVLPPLETLG